MLYMRLLVSVVSLFLSLLCGTATTMPSPQETAGDSGLLQPVSEQNYYDHLPNKELLLTSVQSLVISGDESSAASTVRTQHGGRTQQVAKSPFRYVRDGKVTDIHQHPFLKAAVRQLSGDLSADRYIYTVRRLRI